MKLFGSIAAVAVLGLAALETAQALCPNACSGHGTCAASPKDTCVCYTRKERQSEYASPTTVPDWTGADCSQREFFVSFGTGTRTFVPIQARRILSSRFRSET